MLGSPLMWSHGLGFIAFGIFATYLVLASRKNRRGRLFVSAVVLSAAWEAGAFAVAAMPGVKISIAAHLIDVARLGAWFALLLSLSPSEHREGQFAHPQPLTILIWIALLSAVVLPIVNGLDPITDRQTLGALLAISVLGLVLIERLYRATPSGARWNFKFLYLALVSGFAFDLCLFADGFMFGRIDPAWWSARGLACAFVIPLLSMAAARNLEWSIDIAITRDLVFRSTTLLMSGLYLLATAAVGYYIRDFGGTPGKAAEVAILFAAFLGLAVLLLSGAWRARVRLWISKHFFKRRYDYREEWLRFTQMLSSPGSSSAIGERSLVAIGDLVESTGGALWLLDENSQYAQIARLNFPTLTALESPNSPFIAILARSGALLDLSKISFARKKHLDVELPDWLRGMGRAWLVLPLKLGDEMVGFVVLAAPRVPFEIDWEVVGLLETAAQQAASFLVQQRSAEVLLEGKKFDAFNRMSAFVVHDLKNLVAELALMMKNAERHHANPEFQRDMLDTVTHVTMRMQRLLMQLTAGTVPIEQPAAVNLDDVIRRTAEPKRKQDVMLTLELNAGSQALGHADRIERVIGHLIQNALDATPPTGKVLVRSYRERDFAVVAVADTGIGMSPEFIRERLFKPFQSTKESGMGIGAYESAKYVRSIGGHITVESTPGSGTCVRAHLPLAVRTTPMPSTALETT
ncbi:MAG: XrtA/PEP-CTERM system histidine kinase PrsK [Burkholderiales bacterium]